MHRNTVLRRWGWLFLVLSLLLGNLGPMRPTRVQAQGGFDCTTTTGMPQTECEALVALYEATDGANWHNNTDWLQTTTPCDWYGVTCASGHVSELRLPGNNLNGTLPSDIGQLTALQHLNLGDWSAGNKLSGSIPSEIGNLTSLTHLYLGENQLSGAIPPEIGNLIALTDLDLRDNQLTVLPAEIGKLTVLTDLDLGGNQLTELPLELWSLVNLTDLSLYGNQLTALPPEIGNLVNLEDLNLWGNQLTAMPSEIGNLVTNLTRLFLGDNDLMALPVELWNLTNLTDLYLHGNQLSGTIPPEIGNLVNLTALHLHDNQFSGAIPPEIGNLVNLRTLYLWNNKLSGAIPPEIGNLTNLIDLYSWDNQLSGTIPSEIGNLTNLRSLILWSNKLSGAIPPEIGNLINLTDLGLGNNQFTVLPAEIGNLVNLKELHLSGNQLTALPVELWNLVELTELRLGSNNLSMLPPEIGNLTNLTFLSLWENDLTALPPELWTLTSLTDLRLDGNNLTALPAEIGNLINLKELNLWNNQLTVLPPEIGNLASLTGLYLTSNGLMALPAEIGNLTNLTRFYLHENDLTALPSEISNLANLTYFLLHDNPLSGELPSFLTSLTSLERFTFHGTNWCMPATGPVLTWLADIDKVSGTGKVCGEEPGSLRGTVIDADAKPVAGVQVDLYQPTLWGGWYHITTTQTLADGSYQVDGLGHLGYRVRFMDPTHTYAPEYYDDQATLAQALPVTVTLGEIRTGIDAMLNHPQPPAAIVETGSSVTTNPHDGTVTVNMSRGNTDDITVTRAVTCASGSPTSVTLTLDPPGTVYPMTFISGDDYQATVPAADITQDADLVVAATCGVTTTETIVGHVNLYDPSGTVSDATTGSPVAGATVTLYRVPGWEPKTGPDDDRPNTCQSNDSKDPGEPWSQPAPTDLGVIVNPEITTMDPSLVYQHTDDAGYYGWDVGEGCWYVKVAAEGYRSLTSPVVGVPPEVTDLNLALSPAVNVHMVKSATPAFTITNGSAFTYTLVVSTSAESTLHLYDPLSGGLTWQSFVGDAPDTLTYTMGTRALTGTVTLSATTPLTVTFAVAVNLPQESFVGEYAQVANTAYYYFPGETLALKRPSNEVTRTVHYQPTFDIFLPLVLRHS